MKNISGNAFAFVGFTACCTALEIWTAHGANILWMVVAFWAIFGEFNSEDKE